MPSFRRSLKVSLSVVLASLILLVSLTGVGASGGQHLQRPFKRHDEVTGPHFDFAGALDDEPVLVKSQYNQFAPREPPAHHLKHESGGKNQHGGKGLSRQTLVHWMHKLGLHPSKHQIETLYGLVSGHKHNNHHLAHKEHESKTKGQGKPAWIEVKPEHDGGIEGHAILKRPPVSPGILPPGLRHPHAWGDESHPSDTSKTSSPAAAAVAPLPEPANTIPAPTSTTGPSRGHSSLFPPKPAAAGAMPRNSSAIAPVTSLASTIPSWTSDVNKEDKSGTSGSLNPSATPAPAPPNSGGANGDDRLAPLQNGTNTGKTVAGVPVADDGDLKVAPATSQTANSTRSAGGAGAAAKSGGSSHGHPDPVGWTASATVAGVLLVVLFFAM